MHQLFGNFEDVIDTAEGFCYDLEAECQREPDEQNIGEVFNTHAAAFLDVYVKVHLLLLLPGVAHMHLYLVLL